MERRFRDPDARKRVVEAAWEVVASEGVQAATMRAIAAQAGVTTGFVTHYFDDKEALLVEVVRHNNVRAGTRVVAAVGKGRGLVALESAVDALLPVDADRRREWQVWVAAWRPISGSERLTDELRAGRRFVGRMLQDLLEQAVADDELPGDLDVAYEAERLMTMIAGTGLIAGVETAARIRRAAKRMLAEHVASLERPRDRTDRLER